MKEDYLDLYRKEFGKYHISYDPASKSFEVEGYYDSRTIINYQDLAKYVSQYYDANPVETPEEKAARELREKAIKRNEKIDKLLGNND
jgi:hypothetical protein